MIKRTIEISSKPTHVRVKNRQLVLEQREGNQKESTSIPCEDIGVFVVDQPQTTYTHGALCELMDRGSVLIVCGRDHLPSGLLLPLPNHTEVVWRIQEQIGIGKPLQKQLWQQLVRAKIRGQAANLIEGSAERTKLVALSRKVRSGDPSNVESQAARVYWSAWLDDETEFRRNPNGKDPLNSMLNYGYSVIRGALARSIVAAGLTPAIGLHHSNRSNAFCLADDLLEPLRPLVDRKVRDLHKQGQTQIDRTAKAALLNVLVENVTVRGQSGPLLVALHRMVASLIRCFEGQDKKIVVPE